MILSIIIVNYNGKEYLEACIASVLRSAAVDYEIIVADNHSDDGSVEHIRKTFRDKLGKIKILELDENYGPARARNEAAKTAEGQYLAFLDNDTQVNEHWSRAALELFASDSTIGCIQCKLLLMDEKDRIDYVGEYLGHRGFLVQRAWYKEIDRGQFESCEEILAAKSAGMFIRKDVFDEIRGFDDDYFIYVEETDLGWRAWLRGYKTLFCPRSIVYHKFSTSSVILSRSTHNYNVRFHGTKNYVTTLLKNLGGRNLLLILPFHIAAWILLAAYLALTGKFKNSAHVLEGLFWVPLNWKAIYRKRLQVQLHRKLLDDELFVDHRLMRDGSLLTKARQCFSAVRLGIREA